MTDAPYVPRCGDIVRHRPSDERWVVAWADATELEAAGWPPGIVKIEDCEVVDRCDDISHRKSVDRWRRSSAHDRRRAKVLSLYGSPEERLAGAGPQLAEPRIPSIRERMEARGWQLLADPETLKPSWERLIRGRPMAGSDAQNLWQTDLAACQRQALLDGLPVSITLAQRFLGRTFKFSVPKEAFSGYMLEPQPDEEG